MVATLKKVDETASDWKEKAESTMHKLKEFADLGYTRHRSGCAPAGYWQENEIGRCG